MNGVHKTSFFSAKGCFIKHFNEKLDELSLSLKEDCSDSSSDIMWSYTALNYGEFVQFTLSLIKIHLKLSSSTYISK